MNRIRHAVSDAAIRSGLAVLGALSVYVSADTVFGGVATLGLQGPTDFFTVTDSAAFAVRDSHVRFLGAVWLGVGVVFMAGAVWLRGMRDALMLACALAFVGGLARFTSMSPDELFASGLGVPLIIELVVLPALGAAVWKKSTTDRSAQAPSTGRYAA
jgi:Domain of unknown function (DUF4345)